MEIYIPTPEELSKHISAAFDSVDLINDLAVKTPQEDGDEETMNRNVEHLKIMMGYDWFASALTTEQTTQINAIING